MNYKKNKINTHLNNFNTLYYKLLNEDLSEMSNEELSKHFIKYGKKEERKYSITLPKNFNSDIYKFLNEDLKNLSSDELKVHYYKYGKNENRHYEIVLPKNFDSKTYKLLNHDLREMTDEHAKIHYFKYGKHENRKYKISLPENFDVKVYKLLNNDLYDITDEDAIAHYVNYGENENREYKFIDYKNIVKFKYDNNDQIKKNVSSFCYFENIDVLYEKIKNNIKCNFIFDSFLLIIDFNGEGGTYDFMKYIYMHYVKESCMLAIKPYNDKYNLYVNNIFYNQLNYEEVTLFINININKIEKIFVNSFVGHSVNFIDFILNLKKYKIGITHDFFNFFEKLSPINTTDLKLQTRNYINYFDKIISQNENNVRFVKNFFPNIDISKFEIYDMPDYFSAESKKINNYENRPVCFVGNISQIKGLSIMNDIIQKNENNEFFIFGDSKLEINSMNYSNIHEFNQLLLTVKPLAFIVSPLWNETYSYTLTLMMLSNVDIILYDVVGDCTLKSRLLQYNKHHIVNSIDETFMVISSIKPSENISIINPLIQIPSHWDNIFTTIKQHHENIVLITSKIKVSNTPYNYSNSRSKFTSEERFEQTLQTIYSVRKKIPSCFCILIDNSEFTEDEYTLLKSNLDIIIKDNNMIIDLHTNKNKYKAYGELIQTIYAINYIKNNLNFKNFFKISGRYTLNDTFDINIYKNEDNIFKIKKSIKTKLYVYTSFYKISNKNFETYKNKIENTYNKINLYETHQDFESLIPMSIDFKNVDNLGVTENIAVGGFCNSNI